MAHPEETKTMKPSTGTYNYDTLTGAATITQSADLSSGKFQSGIFITSPNTFNGGYAATPYAGSDTSTTTIYGTIDFVIGSTPPPGTTGGFVADEMSATVNLTGNSHLILQDQIAFGVLTVNGDHTNGTTSLSGPSTIAGGSLHLNTSLDGTGSLNLKSVVTSKGIVNSDGYVNGTVGSGVTVNLQGSGNHGAAGGASFETKKPHAFYGTVGIGNGQNSFGLIGLNADSFNIENDVLSLFHANKLVDQVHVVNSQSGYYDTGGTYHQIGLQVEHNQYGTFVSSAGGDAHQAGGVGTALAQHA